MTATIRWGSSDVPLLRRRWQSLERLPYRKTYALKPGQSWHQAPITERQLEWYVFEQGLGHIPVGAMIARELVGQGALHAAFVEMWGGAVFVNHALMYIEQDGPVGAVFREAKEANGGSQSGFPDVIGVFPDGRISFMEAKRSGKDRLQPQQHRMADAIRKCFGSRADLAVVEWDLPGRPNVG